MRLYLHLSLAVFLVMALPNLSAQAQNTYQIPREPAQLLHDALQPESESTHMARYYATQLLRYHVNKNTALFSPHLAELEALYADIKNNPEGKSSIAAVLLALGSSRYDQMALTLEALRSARADSRSETYSRPALFAQIAREAKPEQADLVLEQLTNNPLPLQWYNEYPTLVSFIDLAGKLLPQTSPKARPDLLAALVAIRQKLSQRFVADAEQEAKFSGVITIWDTSTQEDVNSLLTRFDQAICSAPLTPEAKSWSFVFATKANLMEIDKTTTLTCPIKE